MSEGEVGGGRGNSRNTFSYVKFEMSVTCSSKYICLEIEYVALQFGAK